MIFQVTWDEPDLLQNVKRVNPWLVELVSHVPPIHLAPFSPPRKKLRLQQPEFPLVGQIPVPSFSSNHPLRPSNPLCCISDNIPAGIQGARHPQFGLSPSDLHFSKLQLGLYPLDLQQQIDQTAPPSSILSTVGNQENNENISCLLTIGNSTQKLKKNNEMKAPYFLLFGQPILIEQQVSQSSSGDTAGMSSSEGNPEKTPNLSDGSGSPFHQNGGGPQESSSDEGFLGWYRDHHQKADVGAEIGHCKVFMESEDVGRTLDLSILGSYEELYRKLANMFGIEKRAGMLSNVLYRDEAGIVKQIGDAPFG